MRLTIITPCIRPGNLTRIAVSLEAGRELFDLRWIVAFDASRCATALVPGATTISVYDPDSVYGNAQRNAALSRVRDGWVYFVDDDNLAHPGFFQALHDAIAEHPEKKAFLFYQDMGSLRLRICMQSYVKTGLVDLAQMAARRDFIGPRRFVLDRYEADGLLMESMANDDEEAFGFVPIVATLYNALR